MTDFYDLMSTSTHRTKAIAFHNNKSIILTAHHNGTVQAHDYVLNTLVHVFSDHEGPVRAIAFHPKADIFATGGDDCVVRLYSYHERRIIHVFKGHTDYVRCLDFHPSMPWLLSASDDQSLRVWNFQSLRLLATLTGHSHYVMSARFIGPDSIVSGSLDQSIRVWDCSALRAPKGRKVSGLLGVPDVVVRQIVDGHERGVNWLSVCTGGAPAFASCSDDRTVKLWDFNTVAHEKETLTLHTANVSSVLFTGQRVLSNGEDGLLAVYDCARKRTIKRTAEERFWCLGTDNRGTYAAGHDSGFVVFRLHSDILPYCAVDGVLCYVSKGQVVLTDLGSESPAERVLCGTKKEVLGVQLSLEPFRVLLQHRGSFVVVDEGGREVMSGIEGWLCGKSVVGVSNRVLVVGNERVEDVDTVLRDGEECYAVRDRTVWSVCVGAVGSVGSMGAVCGVGTMGERSVGASGTAAGSTTHDANLHPNLNHNPNLNHTPTEHHNPNLNHPPTEHHTQYTLTLPFRPQRVAVSPSYKAFTAQTQLCITNTHTILFTATEASTIYGGFFTSNVFVYATAKQIKYVLLGDTPTAGVLRSTDKPSSVFFRKQDVLYFVSADSVESVRVTFKEVDFKQACTAQVDEALQEGALRGLSMLSYLVQRSMGECVLPYLEDPVLRFEVLLSVGRLEECLEVVRRVGCKKMWRVLLGAALRGCDLRVGEECLRVLKESRVMFYVCSKQIPKCNGEGEGMCVGTCEGVLGALYSGNTAYIERVLENGSVCEGKDEGKGEGDEERGEGKDEGKGDAGVHEELHEGDTAVHGEVHEGINGDTAVHGEGIHGDADVNDESLIHPPCAPPTAPSCAPPIPPTAPSTQFPPGDDELSWEEDTPAFFPSLLKDTPSIHNPALSFQEAMALTTQGKFSSAVDLLEEIAATTAKSNDSTLREALGTYLSALKVEKARRKEEDPLKAVQMSVYVSTLPLLEEHRVLAMSGCMMCCFRHGNYCSAKKMAEWLSERVLPEKMKKACCKVLGYEGEGDAVGCEGVFCFDVMGFMERGRKCLFCGVYSASGEVCMCCGIGRLEQ